VKTILIGDPHGRYKQLRAVLDLIGFDPIRHKLVCLGDYLDYGPDSKLVVDYLIWCRKQGPQHIFIRGNHENAVLDAWRGRSVRADFLGMDPGMRTVRSYGRDPGEAADRSRRIANHDDVKDFVEWLFPPDHLQFFDATAPYAWLDKVFISHAGLIRGLAIEAHKPEFFFSFGDRSWVETRSSDDEPPVVCGHWHQAEEPLVDYKRIFMAVESNLPVLWLEELTVVNSEGVSWPIEADWLVRR
jgi:serine/threonine protein phosphatase 1